MPPKPTPDFRDVDVAPGTTTQLIRLRVAVSYQTFLNFVSRYNLYLAQFIFSTPNIEDVGDADDTWIPQRLIGQGGYGLVGLWARLDTNGQPIEHCVIKEAAWDPDTQYKGSDDTRLPGLQNEAVIQSQLNSINDSESILHLYRCKHYPADFKVRMYLEYCPHGDLETLKNRYRMWDRYLPEEFLWHVFESLAKAAALMQQGPNPWVLINPPGLDAPVPGGVDAFLLHFDLKPPNIFLADPVGDADPDDVTAYPSIKVADFGLAHILRPVIENDPATRMNPNPGEYLNEGTLHYIPPEQNLMAAHWDDPPGGQMATEYSDVTNAEAILEVKKDDYFLGLRLEPRHNIWGIGKIMSDLLYLDHHNDYDAIVARQYNEKQQEDAYDNGDMDLAGERATNRNPEYSNGLRDLIRQCMDIHPDKRPTAVDLVRQTGTMLRGSRLPAGRKLTAAQRRSRKVFYRGHEIQDSQAQPGVTPFSDADYIHWNEVIDTPFDDPSLPPLIPPGDRWISFNASAARKRQANTSLNAANIPMTIVPDGNGGYNLTLGVAPAAIPLPAGPPAATPAAVKGCPRNVPFPNRTYCRHPCFTGTTKAGNACRHLCCRDGIK